MRGYFKVLEEINAGSLCEFFLVFEMGSQTLKPPSKQSLNGHSIMMLCLVLIVFFLPRHATAGVFSDLSFWMCRLSRRSLVE